MIHRESALQSSCVHWFRLQYPRTVIFAIPNGGNRSPITGAILKREGALPGVADLFVMRPNHTYAGLFIEMKTTKGKSSPPQLAFAQATTTAGYAYYICHSLDEFITTVRSYMTL
jgi:hypothetical protein